MEVRVERERQRFLKSVLRAHFFIANILNKSSAFPVRILFLYPFIAFFFSSSYSLFIISPLQGTETGSKEEHSKNKLQNTNFTKATKFYACYRDFVFLTVPDAFPL